MGHYYCVRETSTQSFWFSRDWFVREHYFDSLAKADEFNVGLGDLGEICEVDEEAWEDAQDDIDYLRACGGDCQIFIHESY